MHFAFSGLIIEYLFNYLKNVLLAHVPSTIRVLSSNTNC